MQGVPNHATHNVIHRGNLEENVFTGRKAVIQHLIHILGWNML
jgi:hypothetical protein